MKRKLLLSLVLLTVIISSCGDIVESEFTCQDFGEYLGEFKLTDEADDFWAYEANQRRIYVDSLGNEHILQQSGQYVEEVRESVIRIICRTPEWEQREEDVADTEMRRVQYSGNNAYFSLNLSSIPVEITDTTEVFMDIFSISSSGSYYTFAASNRGNETPVPDFYKIEYLETLDEVTLLGKTFEDVYYDTLFETPVYFNKSQGVVALYNWEGTLLVLDRVE